MGVIFQFNHFLVGCEWLRLWILSHHHAGLLDGLQDHQLALACRVFALVVYAALFIKHHFVFPIYFSGLLGLHVSPAIFSPCAFAWRFFRFGFIVNYWEFAKSPFKRHHCPIVNCPPPQMGRRRGRPYPLATTFDT
jgi:hypothetical protein